MSRLLAVGVVGTVLAAICCFTPALVIAFGVLGLSAWVGAIDLVALPALVIFAGVTVYALVRTRRTDRTTP